MIRPLSRIREYLTNATDREASPPPMLIVPTYRGSAIINPASIDLVVSARVPDGREGRAAVTDGVRVSVRGQTVEVPIPFDEFEAALADLTGRPAGR